MLPETAAVLRHFKASFTRCSIRLGILYLIQTISWLHLFALQVLEAKTSTKVQRE